ncbi:MAG: Ppx/GppA phosphatase family protein, partial [Rhizobiaceae bacterium]
LIDRESKGVVLFDIGGGSSELALLDLRKRKRNDFGPSIISWTSLPVGVVTLSERHGGGKQVTRSVFEAMVAEVGEMLGGYEERGALAEAAAEGDVHLLGTSGTVTTLAGIHLELPKYDRRQVDGVWMGSRQIGLIVDQLVDMSFEERMQNPCIGRDRADLVLAGCAILVAIQNLWPYPRLRVADRGLREGLLMEMMNADNVWRNFPNSQNHQGRLR